MIRFVRFLIIAVVAIVLLLFVFANRQWVTVSFDPFSSADNAAYRIPAPLVRRGDRCGRARRDRGRGGDLGLAGPASPRRAQEPRRGEPVARRGPEPEVGPAGRAFAAAPLTFSTR